MIAKRGRAASPTAVAGMGGIIVTLATGVMVSLSAGVAAAFASEGDPTVQMKILREALADGTAVPMFHVKSVVDKVQTAFPDKTPPPSPPPVSSPNGDPDNAGKHKNIRASHTKTKEKH